MVVRSRFVNNVLEVFLQFFHFTLFFLVFLFWLDLDFTVILSDFSLFFTV